VVVGLVQVLATRAVADPAAAVPLDGLAYALLVAGPVALVGRRRLPALTLVVTLAATVGYALAGYPRGPFFLAAIVAVVSAVAAGHRALARTAAVVAYVVFVVAGPLLDRFDLHPPGQPGLGAAVGAGVWLLVLLALAEANRVRAQHIEQIMRMRAEQGRARAEQERRQASEERLRIARELHDVLGHHMSLINVQAGIGLHLMDSRPEQAREALTAIKTASAEALREVRSVLAVLQPDEEAAPRTPAPGLDRLPALAGEAGFPVDVTVRGRPRPLPAEIDRAAYRIVQEALTNVRRHGGGAATAQVTVDYGRTDLSVQVDNDSDDADAASDPPPSTGDGGSGIPGMRARTSALGGTLRAGRRPDGRFQVEARIPLAPDTRGDRDPEA
jgi:signal transduction histidine kinase